MSNMLHHLYTSPWFERMVFWATYLSGTYNFVGSSGLASEEISGWQLGFAAFSVPIESSNLFYLEEMRQQVVNGDWPEFVVPLRAGFEIRIREIGDTGNVETSHEQQFWLRDSCGEDHYLGDYSGNHYLPAFRW